MGGKKKSNPSSGSCDSNVILGENFGLHLLEVLNDQDIQDGIRKLFDYDRLADIVQAKMQKQFSDLTLKLAKKDEEIKDLKNQVEILKLQADSNEQYSRRSTIRIGGIPETEQEAVEEKTRSILQDIGISSDVEIQRCHRVGPKQDSAQGAVAKPRPVLCQFTGQKDKISALTKWKVAWKNFKTISINEDLTRFRSQLAFKARELKRAEKISDTWTADGKILVKDLKNYITVIRTERDLKW